MPITIDELELAAAPGWRATEEARLGDWLLRAAGGFTGRANSALAVGGPGMPLADAVAFVRRWYGERGLPAVIAVPFPAGAAELSALDRLLSGLGWTIREDAAIVMTARAAAVAARGAPGGPHVTIAAEPDAAWLASYHYRGQELPAVALRVLTSAPWQAFGSIRHQDRTIAIGRVAAARGWAGLTAIEVDPAYRGHGLGAAITTALAASAADLGAGCLYLQVTSGNLAARSLYCKLGFADHHQYHYRIAPNGSRSQ